MLSFNYPKPRVVSYEKTMFMSTSFLWFFRFQPSASNSAVFHLATSIDTLPSSFINSDVNPRSTQQKDEELGYVL
jgi:hypothetical protein